MFFPAYRPRRMRRNENLRRLIRETKLSVDDPVLFAVTIEKPGGVVVSKRERIVVTAAPKTG